MTLDYSGSERSRCSPNFRRRLLSNSLVEHPDCINATSFPNVFKISRRATKAYHLYKFIKVLDHFHEFGSIQKQERAKTNSKRTEEVVENMKRFVQENPGTLLRKTSQQVFCTEKWSLKKILSIHFGSTTDRCSQSRAEGYLPMDSWAVAWHRREYHEGWRKNLLPPTEAIQEERWSLD